MRHIELMLQPNGSTKFSYTSKLFNLEHDAMQVVVDYALVNYPTHLKRVEVKCAQFQLIYNSNGSQVTFALPREAMSGEIVQIQPIAYLVEEDLTTQEIKWAITKFTIEPSLNVLWDDTTITPTLVEQLVNRIVALESTIIVSQEEPPNPSEGTLWIQA